MAKKVLIIGATGNFGLEVRKFLLANTDYELTLISRHAENLNIDSQRERAINVDATNLEALKEVIAGQDIVFSALYAHNLSEIVRQIVKAMNETGVERLFFTAAMGIYNEIPEDIDPERIIQSYLVRALQLIKFQNRRETYKWNLSN